MWAPPFLLLLVVAVSRYECKDLSGRWVEDQALGISVVSAVVPGGSSFKVENLMWRTQKWHWANLTINEGDKLSLDFDNGAKITGELWPSTTGTHIAWSNGVGWHLYGSDVTCQQQTKRFRWNSDIEKGEREEEKSIKSNGSVQEVHVVIMTHFDLGYTDFAWCVISRYFWQIYPGVVQTSLIDKSFIFTTHPWILYLHMNCDRLKKYIITPPDLQFMCPTQSMVTDLEAMIKRGQLTWHAFAYDGFNELLGETLFSLSFNYARWLSDKYSVSRIETMSNIDIPGLYQAQLPTILKEGVEGLYIGQNSFPGWAGAILQLPNLFLWQNPINTTQTLITMTHKLGYGGLTPFDAVIDPTGEKALVVQCVLENSPPYSPLDVSMYLDRVQRYFPSAKVKPSTFDAFLKTVKPNAHKLPVVSKDVGDTWVRAIPSDPVRTSTFLAQRRDFEDCIAKNHCKWPSNSTLDELLFLITVPEHNWGLPFQYNSWETSTLSYQEKRDFLKSARLFRENSGKSAEKEKERKVSSDVLGAPCAIVAFDSEAAISKLEWMGIPYANSTHRLGLVLYTEHALQGLKGEEETGWGDPVAKFLSFKSTPKLHGVSGDGCTLFKAKSYLNQNDSYVGPMELTHTLQFYPQNNSATLSIEFVNKAISVHMYQTWNDKVNYGGAASVQFLPARAPQPWSLEVLGVKYSPENFAPNGTSHYHIVDSATFPETFTVRPLDTPLLLFGNNSASWFSDWSSPPDYSTGAWFNIFNQWNANWVVGWPWVANENVTARYEISLFKQE